MLTLTEIADRAFSADTWYITAAIGFVVLYILTKFVFGRMRMSVMIFAFGLFIFMAYGKIFIRLFESVPDLSPLYQYLQGRVSTFFLG